MKKLKIVIALFLTGFMLYLHKPAQFKTQALLSAPSSWDYAYIAEEVNYNLYDWVLKTPSNFLEVPVYTQTDVNGYYNYTTTMQYSPFPITLTFRRSNTGWDSVYGGYVPIGATIGSDNTVGTIVGKFDIELNNDTNKNYAIYLDLSSTPNTHPLIWTYNTEGFGYGNGLYYYAEQSSINKILIPAYTTLKLTRSNTLSAHYFDAFYLKDLGVSSAYTNGNYDGLVDGFNSGYGVGYDEGELEGYSEGQSDFFYGIYGVWDGLIQESIPWLTGYNSGYNMANPTELIGGLITAIFTGMAPIFGIVIVGGITFGSFIIIPLSQTVLSWFFRTFGGGK